MKKNFLIAISILIILVLACGRGKKDEEKEETTEKNKKEKIEDKDEQEEKEVKEKIVYGNPIIIENSDLILIPVTLTETDEDFFGRIKKEYFDSDQSFSPYSQNFRSFSIKDMHNVIFYNKVTEEVYPLIEKRELINNFYIPQNPSKDTAKTNFIIFSTISNDYNKDGKIDKKDGETVFICDIDGKNKKQISDNNITLLKWEIDLKYDLLFLVLKEDTDDDNKFTSVDDIKIFKTSISNPGMPVEIISDSLKNDLENIYK